ncbi:hypothetical protein HMPREF1313_0878 [Bifidobacterium longum subsp. longum 1-6B]|uniref:Uncharacterized protein n=1 Tax=Bifidobacterium longum subsp. longum 1-6B TaxID=1161744 RepID=A0AA87ICK5_BIFLL|nr:hypothetical protein HMPREF1313_0878 [Bifidobacterium longum subsp. longum 1-6B]EIJ30496.1 hypothetical protein HMPREF1312_1372 [Bifidobacterium longum subsp. longum 44B]
MPRHCPPPFRLVPFPLSAGVCRCPSRVRWPRSSIATGCRRSGGRG